MSKREFEWSLLVTGGGLGFILGLAAAVAMIVWIDGWDLGSQCATPVGPVVTHGQAIERQVCTRILR